MSHRAQARLDPGRLPLGSQENALEDGEHLSERQRVVFPVLRPYHFSASLEEPFRNPTKRLRPETHWRVPLAKNV